MTLELFQLVLDSDRDNLAKTILESLGVDSSKREKKYLVTMLYLVCKVLNIGKKYPEYILQANNFEPYEVNDALEIQGKPSHLNLVTVLLAIVKEDLEKGSHVTLKVARAINFLNGYSKIKMLYRYGIVDEDTQGIRASELMDKVTIIMAPYIVWRNLNMLCYQVFLNKRFICKRRQTKVGFWMVG